MKKDFILKVIQENKGKYFPDEFQFVSRGDGQWFERRIAMRKERIYIAIPQYYRYCLSSVSASILFKEVEQMIVSYYNQYGLHNYKLDSRNTVFMDRHHIFGKTGIEINEENDVLKGMEKLKVFFEKESLPFFEQFQTVEDVNLHLKRTKAVQEFRLTGMNFYKQIRKVVIAFVAKDIDAYHEYEKEARELFDFQKNKEELHKRHWNVFVKLSGDIKKHLNTM